ncbi:MAG: hypothetical protein WCB94_08160 [Terriglobales bacterium]
MNIISMMNEVLSTANPMIGESALPHFRVSPDQSAERMRVSALDQLDGALDCHVLSRSKQEMNVIGHKDEGVQCIATFSTVVVKGLEE